MAFISALLSWSCFTLAQAPVSPTQAAELSKSPGYNGQLLLKLGHKGQNNFNELDQEKVKEIPFSGARLYFYYALRRDRKEERRPGAVIVKVIYLYGSGKEDIEEWAKDTELFRNPFPDRSNILENAIRRPYYVNYHKDEKDNIFLIHNFHAKYRDRERTDGTYQRRRHFLFTSDPQWNPAVRRQRAYLIYYSGVDDQGTWIPFDVGITNQMCDLLINVIDLGEPGSDLVERSWHLRKKTLTE